MITLPLRVVAPGECLVVGGPTSCSGATCDVPSDFSPDLLNTSTVGAPGLGLFQGTTVTAASVPTDAVVYGTGTLRLLSPAGTVFTAVSVAPVAPNTSIERYGAPADATWRAQAVPTPGVCTAITP